MLLFLNLDVRTKLICILLLTILVFLVNKLETAVCLLLSFVIIRLIVKVPFKAGRLFKNLALLAVFVILMQMIFGPGDTYIVKSTAGDFNFLKWEGLLFGLVIVCRLFALMVILPVFTETTPHNQIAAGLCSLGFNYKNAFLVTSAFNLIPSFKDEASRIMDAQKLRGCRSFDKKTIFSGIKAYCSLLIPLMLDAMRKAQISSVAMDCRAFGIYKTRTWIDKPLMKKIDYFTVVFCIVYISCMLIFNYY
ncbi:MAG: energy-coupling factor transporter transmembrane protein EcfT [Treponema sp.]|jgi:energy-coupling factor transport system permease protein|nr:energy-coupling factor transporter transmembrane protein EcfT [Treponema sp.]